MTPNGFCFSHKFRLIRKSNCYSPLLYIFTGFLRLPFYCILQSFSQCPITFWAKQETWLLDGSSSHFLLIRIFSGSMIIRFPLKSSSDKSSNLSIRWWFISIVGISLGKCATTIPKCLPNGKRRILPKPLSLFVQTRRSLRPLLRETHSLEYP